MSEAKLFLFGIGGTGSRVLKALSFLLASGVKANIGRIVPIIIDPDTANGDMMRTEQILKLYREIRNRGFTNKTGFFQTEIQTLASLHGDKRLEVPDNFRFDIDGTREGIFSQFLDLNGLEESDRALVELLFSQKNLSSELSVGFKGNPHMGSVVLNQFKNSKEFKYFASSFSENDRIFIISSIFGGTGAAGFPLLVKNIREAGEELSNSDRLRRAPIGAITVMPYFGVAPDRSIAIDKNTFISKTKAALAYYSAKMSGVNALYYIGDTYYTKDHKASEGRQDQENDAHVVELFSALSILHFLDIDDNRLKTREENDGSIKPSQHFFFEYGTHGNYRILNFNNLGQHTRRQIVGPVSRLAFVVNFWQSEMERAIANKKPWTNGKRIQFDQDFLGSAFYRNYLRPFKEYFIDWVTEMARNERSFDALNLNTTALEKVVKHFDPSPVKTWYGAAGSAIDYEYMNALLDRAAPAYDNLEAPQKFLAAFYEAGDNIIKKHYKQYSDIV